MTAKGGRETAFERIQEHYRLEVRLARRLCDAAPEERRHLYSTVYSELYERVPYLREGLPLQELRVRAAQMARFLQRFLTRDSVFLEIGAGSCALSLTIAKSVDKVYAVEVYERMVDADLPENFQFILSDACSIPVPEESVDVAYSAELLEHLQKWRRLHLPIVPEPEVQEADSGAPKEEQEYAMPYN